MTHFTEMLYIWDKNLPYQTGTMIVSTGLISNKSTAGQPLNMLKLKLWWNHNRKLDNPLGKTQPLKSSLTGLLKENKLFGLIKNLRPIIEITADVFNRNFIHVY